MSEKYVLDANRNPMPCEDLMEWAEWFELVENRRVAQDQVGDVKISTVFLGIDHNFGGGGMPILFETMIFGGEHDQWQDRCCTWDEAEEMHKRALDIVGTKAEIA